MAYNWGNQGWKKVSNTICFVYSLLQETPITGLQRGTHTMMHMPLRDVENIIAATKDKEDRQNYYGTALVIKSWFTRI
jgi:hypothetical protein